MKYTSVKRGSVAALGAAALVLSVAACGAGSSDAGSPGGKKTYTIAVATQLLGVPYDVSLDDGVREQAAKIAKENGVEIEIVSFDAKGDVQRQASQVQNMIAQQVDGIILMPVSPGPAQSMVDAAERAGIPIGTMHGFIGDDPEKVYSKLSFQVNIQNVNGSKMVADTLIDALPDGGDVAMVLGAAGFQDNDLAQEGFLPALEAAGNFSVVSKVPGDWTKEGGQSACANIFTAHPDTKAVYALSDDMAQGCVAAAKAAGISPLIVGNGGQQSGIDNVTSGAMYATQCQEPFSEGEVAMGKLWDVLDGKGEDPVTLTAMPIKIILKDNVSDCTPQY